MPGELIKIGNDTAGTFLQFVGDARAWKDFNFGVGALGRGASAPDFVNIGSTSIPSLAFDGVNTLEQVSVALEMNHEWAEGTTVKAHLHWYPSTSAAGSVKWNLEYVFVNFGASVVGASTTITVTQTAGGVAWAPRFATFPDVDLTGFVIGTQVHARLFRDPTDGDDDYGADAAIGTLGFHVLVDSLGSRQPASK